MNIKELFDQWIQSDNNWENLNKQIKELEGIRRDIEKTREHLSLNIRKHYQVGNIHDEKLISYNNVIYKINRHGVYKEEIIKVEDNEVTTNSNDDF